MNGTVVKVKQAQAIKTIILKCAYIFLFYYDGIRFETRQIQIFNNILKTVEI